jgi:Na+/proline symporter/nitrogen-specific signal transduction histidine kinase
MTMLQDWVILIFSFLYLSLLFGIAYYGDKRADMGRSIIANPYIYTLSIAVYCTAWTYYGSVGRSASTGIGFLPIYLGPTIMAAGWWLVLRKMIRIAKQHRITSIADFIGSRYGKSTLLAGLVSVIVVIGIVPYISLQLKGISTAFEVARLYPDFVGEAHARPSAFWTDTSFYIAMMLAAFTILFGTRHIDATERHEGMVAAIAFESMVKLVAFLSVGVFVTFVVFAGPGDLFARAAESESLRKLMSFDALPGGYGAWLSLTFLSMMAIMFLPRQFQVAVVENVNEEHVKKASWLFPLYLLVINIFVLPIAIGGHLLLAGTGVDPDTFVLTLPMKQHAEVLTLIVFIGGLSAATGMVIVETIALSTMVCNDLVMPALLRIPALRLTEKKDLTKLLLGIRRWAIVVVLLLGYIYFALIGESYSLVTIGLVSFAAVAQFGPPILIGIYWKGASRAGAAAGLIGGFLIWAYTLLLPGFAQSGWMPVSFIESGPFGIELLRPYQLFGLTGLDIYTHAVFWSMLANIGGLVGVSLVTRQSALEQVQAALFTDIFNTPGGGESYIWGGTATVSELRALVARFLGEANAKRQFANYAQSRNLRLSDHDHTDPPLINFAERLLAGAIGAASARVMISSIVKGEALSIESVMQILDETSQVLEYSRRLEQKSRELETATAELRAANERLEELDRLKDEFVSTVSHELRTPLTSIRAFSEILRNNIEMAPHERQQFLDIVVRETERLTRLINEVLDLAKMESGRMEWRIAPHDLRELISDALNSVSQLLKERQIDLRRELPAQPAVASVDRDRMIQVLINLLSNAAKFTQPGGRVEVRLIQVKNELHVEVTDSGPGIAPEHLARVFDKFYQVGDPQGTRPKGTGLGLTICQRIVEHLNGRIWAESSPGSGATFKVVLPEYEIPVAVAAK